MVVISSGARLIDSKWLSADDNFEALIADVNRDTAARNIGDPTPREGVGSRLIVVGIFQSLVKLCGGFILEPESRSAPRGILSREIDLYSALASLAPLQRQPRLGLWSGSGCSYASWCT